LALSRSARWGTGCRGKLFERSEFFAPPVPHLGERGRLSGRAAFSFDSFLWASKEKNAAPAGRQRVVIAILGHETERMPCRMAKHIDIVGVRFSPTTYAL
jgi:hypothetical protein